MVFTSILVFLVVVVPLCGSIRSLACFDGFSIRTEMKIRCLRQASRSTEQALIDDPSLEWTSPPVKLSSRPFLAWHGIQ